jgi:hypothetical protein
VNVTGIGELRKTLAITSNQSTLRKIMYFIVTAVRTSNPIERTGSKHRLN